VNSRQRLKYSRRRRKRKTQRIISAKKEINEIVVGKVLNEIAYHHYSIKYGSSFEASIGAEAIYTLFSRNLILKKKKKHSHRS
jgi:hypothetical protein